MQTNSTHKKTSIKVFLTTPPLKKLVEPIYDKPLFIRTSLASLSSVLRQNLRIKLKVLDAKFEQITLNSLLEKITTFNPDILGISSYTYEFLQAIELANAVKQTLPRCKIVIGGSHVSSLPFDTLKNYSCFDIAVLGEAEETIQELCDVIIKDKDLSLIQGIAFRSETEEIIFTPERKKIEDLDILPMPAWDLFPGAKEYFIQSSRGCPFKCNFCFNPNGQAVRLRSVKKIIEEIEWLIENKHPKRISFGDEAFGANHSWTKELLLQIIEKQIYKKISWDIQTHVSFINEEILQLMKNAGISRIEMGVESGNEEILKRMGKGINKSLVLNKFRLVQKYKIKTGAFFIIGHPNETLKSIKDTIFFAGKLNPTEAIFALMVPFPGTKIYEYAQQGKFGYNTPDVDWSKYRKQISNNFSMKSITNFQFRAFLLLGFLWVYISNFRFLGLIRFVLRNRKSILSFFCNKTFSRLF